MKSVLIARRYLPFIIPLALLFVLIAWRLNSKRAEQATQSGASQAGKKMAPSVAVAPVKIGDVVHTFQSVGTVEAPLNVKLSPKVSGRINYLEVHEGDSVSAGQVLVRVDTSQVDADVHQKQADLAETESRLAQAQITQGSTNVGITSQIEQQQANLVSAQADYNQTRENFNAQVVTANAAVIDAQNRVGTTDASIANAGAQINSAKANLANAQSKYKRMSTLLEKGFVAAQLAEDARTEVDVQQAAVEVANGQLRSAQAEKNSALAQVTSAKNQAKIVRTKGLADIQAAKAKVSQAQSTLKMARANTSQRSAYRANLAALQAAVDSARAALRSTEAQRADTVLRSPIDGSVTKRDMDPGSLATPGQPVLELQSMRNVWVSVAVPEEVSRKITLGQTAEMTFDALTGRKFTGKAIQINPAADPTSRQFVVRIGLDNPENLLKPGMFGHVNIVTDRVNGAVVVPREAVTQKEGKASVMVVDKSSVAHETPVTLGPGDDNQYAITEGLRAGEKVVVMTGRPIKDGQEVRTGGKGKGKKGGQGGGNGPGEEKAGGGPGGGENGSGGTQGGGAPNRRGGNGS